MKLLNYKCIECEEEKELWDDEDPEVCSFCGGKLKEWNFKNNTQRVSIMDQQK